MVLDEIRTAFAEAATAAAPPVSGTGRQPARAAALEDVTAVGTRAGGHEGYLDLADLLEHVPRPAEVVEEGVELLGDALGIHRRIWEDTAHDRAQIEVHGIADPSAVGLRRRLAQALARIEDVRWAEVNAITGRVAVAFDGGEPTLSNLIDLIDGLEETFGTRRDRSNPAWDTEERADHPADDEPIHRVIAIAAGDLLSLGWAAAGRVARVRRLPAELAGIVTIVDNNPWLRLQAERVLGRRVSALVLPLVGAAVSGISPLGAIVDLGVQAALLDELRARRRVWAEQEPLFYAVSSDDHIDPPDIGPRPVPLPDGPIEDWVNRAGGLGLAAAGSSLVATRSLRTGIDVLIASTPRAARLGREGFAALLGRTLAYRGIVPLDGSALRRLDRIDTVVLDAEVLTGDEVGVRRVVTPSGDPAGEAQVAAAERLFVPEAPQRVRRRAPWRLSPFADVDPAAVAAARGARSRAREIRAEGGTPLALLRADEVVAIVDVAPVLGDAVAPVVEAIRAAGHRLVVADGDGRVARQLDADARLRAGDTLGEQIRELQAEGAGVMVIGRQGHSGLAAADVGLGVVAATGRPSWGADLILGHELADAATIVAATSVARQVSERSARFAMSGSALGGLVAVAGPRTGAGARVLAMVNGAAGAALVSGSWAAVQLAHAPRPRAPHRTRWHELTTERALELAASDGQEGLATAEVAQRGTVTSLASGEVTPLEPFLAELANPLNPVLAAGAGLSAATRSMGDAALVLGLIGVNTVVGGVQRLRADRTVRQLLERDLRQVAVVRDGREQQLAEDELVRGDVIVLRAGDPVPADARILEADGCEVDESSLTGESLPVTKTPDATPDAEVADRTCILFEHTTVVAGSARAVVVATGEHTEVARSLALTGPPPPTGVELRLEELTRRLVPAALGVAGLTAGVGALRRWPAADIAGTAVSLSIASVPEGLPFVATAGQLAGARRLAQRGAVVRNPRTVEALGRVDVLCVDKTGTLTEGRVAVTGVSDGRTEVGIGALTDEARRTLLAALRASDQPGDHGRGLDDLDDADQALHQVADGLGLDPIRDLGPWTVVDDLPFEASRGLHAVLGRNGQRGRDHRILVKGAPEVLLDSCDTWAPGGEQVALDETARAEVTAHVDELARQGHRLLAVADRAVSATSDVGEGRIERLCLRGFIVLADPVRDTAAAAVQGIARAGVRTIMVTGDHPETAASIARQLGIGTGGRVLTGPDVDAVDDDELARLLGEVQVVARVTPAAKLRVVSALQGAGHVVAMTGDGANDAAAIRLAEVGVALGRRSSTAARDAADIVITDDQVETLIDAIAEGRALWASVREALAVLVGGNLGEIGFTTIASTFSRRAPLHPRQFLLVNLFTDLAPAMAIAVRPPTDVSAETLLREGPEASLGDALRRDMAIRGTATAAGATAAWTASRLTTTGRRSGTVGLAALVGTQLGQTIVAGGWREPATMLTVAGSAAGLVAAVQTPVVSRFFGSRPLGPLGWSQAITASVAATLGSEVAARVANRLDAFRAEQAARDETPVPPRGRRAPVNARGEGPTRVLVTGATGYVGRALVPALLEDGHEVVCLVAPGTEVPAAWRGDVTVVEGSAGDEESVRCAGHGCSVAYHLDDSVAEGVDGLAARDRAAAVGLAGGLDLAGVAHVVHLGALVDETALARTSEPAFARQQVGEELRAGPVPVLELRAGPVIGPGSPTVAVLRAAAGSPLDLTGPLGGSRVQPIALDDLVVALVAALDDDPGDGRTVDLGGPDQVTYRDLVACVRSRLGRRRARRVPATRFTPEVLAMAASRAGDVPLPVAMAVVRAAEADALVDDRHHAAGAYAPLVRTPLDEALALAMAAGTEGVRTPSPSPAR
jgi:cation-transporting P-type ATPase I